MQRPSPARSEAAEPPPLGETGAVVRLRGVSVRYGAVTALERVGFHVPQGSITGLIGRNGAGKSTTIRVLAGLLTPDGEDADVEVFGLDPAVAGPRIRARTGYLLADPAVFAYLTARETLGFIVEAYGLPRPVAARRTASLLAFFELEDAADRVVDGFSTGMRKRLELAAALIHAPPLLVLDEPFESLDPLMVRSLKQLLRHYSAGGGTTLLSSHLIDAVDEICERIVILEAGRVVAAGPTAEAKRGVEGSIGAGSLEDLYASVIPAGDVPELEWLWNEISAGPA